MKITAVRTILLSAPSATPVMEAVHYIPARSALLGPGLGIVLRPDTLERYAVER